MFQKILVPLDGSDEAEQALRTARAVAVAFRAELRLVTVEEMPNEPTPGEWDLTVGSLMDKRRELVQQNLDRLAKSLSGDELKVSTAVLPLGPAAPRILEEARECKADLIVLFSHGRTGLSRIFLGSVAERLTRHAPCPVMIVHRSEKAPAGE